MSEEHKEMAEAFVQGVAVFQQATFEAVPQFVQDESKLLPRLRPSKQLPWAADRNTLRSLSPTKPSPWPLRNPSCHHSP